MVVGVGCIHVWKPSFILAFTLPMAQCENEKLASFIQALNENVCENGRPLLGSLFLHNAFPGKHQFAVKFLNDGIVIK